MATTINSLTEYLKQEDPKKNVKVIVGEADIKKINKIKVGDEDFTVLSLITDVKDKKHLVEGIEYVLIGNEGFLRVIDSDGNPKSESVFYFEPNSISSYDKTKAEMKGKSMDERKKALISRIKKHNWSSKKIMPTDGIVRVHSEMYDIGKETVAALFNEHQAPANGKKMESGGEIDDNYGNFSTFKYYKVPNENLWAIQECNDEFEDGFGSKCAVIRNKKSEAEAKKEVDELNKKEVERMFNYYDSYLKDYDSGAADKRRYHVMYKSLSGKDFLVHSTDDENKIEQLVNLAKKEVNKDGKEYEIWVVDTMNGEKYAKGGQIRSKSALSKDRKYTSDEPHELDYRFKRKSKVMRYDTKMAKGGFVGKGEMVWKNLNASERMDFLQKNFTPEITPTSQEILVGKSYNFLPKNVKIKIESTYANVDGATKSNSTNPEIETKKASLAKIMKVRDGANSSEMAKAQAVKVIEKLEKEIAELEASNVAPAAPEKKTRNPRKPKEVASTEKTKEGVSPLESIFIEWHEGTGEFDGKTVKTWSELQHILTSIYNNAFKNHGDDGGYEKVKVLFTWKNGKSIEDRIDVGNGGGDFNPTREKIGDYLKKQEGAMYKSNFAKGTRNLVSWEDSSSTVAPTKPEKKKGVPSPYLKDVQKLAKEIRKEGETHLQAMSRAHKLMKEKKSAPKPKKKTITSKKRVAAKSVAPKSKKKKITSKKRALTPVPNRTELGEKMDAKRQALPSGKRISADGNVYYESRENRADKFQPKKKNITSKRRKLAKGGEVDSEYVLLNSDTNKIYLKSKNKSFVELKLKEFREIYPNEKIIIDKSNK